MQMTGEMPPDVKAMYDGIAGMLEADPNGMRLPADNIKQKREEIGAMCVEEEAAQKEANKPWASSVQTGKIMVKGDDGYEV